MRRNRKSARKILISYLYTREKNLRNKIRKRNDYLVIDIYIWVSRKVSTNVDVLLWASLYNTRRKN